MIYRCPLDKLGQIKKYIDKNDEEQYLAAREEHCMCEAYEEWIENDYLKLIGIREARIGDYQYDEGSGNYYDGIYDVEVRRK